MEKESKSLSKDTYTPKKDILKLKEQKERHDDMHVRAQGRGSVYPLSIVYSQKKKRQMILFRVMVLLLVLVLCIPKDSLNLTSPYFKQSYIDS